MLGMTAMTLLLLFIVALFALGFAGVFLFLHYIDKLFPEKKKGSEHEDEREETPGR